MDDRQDIRTLIALNLEFEGFEVYSAVDGQECLDIVEALEPDVITMDVSMPRLDGLETVARLRANPATAHIPIVMVSARAQGSDLERGRAAGADAYVTKPFDPEHLVATVRSLIPKPRASPDDEAGGPEEAR